MKKQVSYLHYLGLLAGLQLFSSGCALLELAAPASTPAGAIPTVAGFPTLGLPNSASAFDHNTLAGQTAPAFTLPDAGGQAYTFTPNDGRKHLVIFYMVYT